MNRIPRGFMACPACSGNGFVTDPVETDAAMRKARKDAALSLREVARRLQVSAAYLSDLELGRRAWTRDKRESFLKAIR